MKHCIPFDFTCHFSVTFIIILLSLLLFLLLPAHIRLTSFLPGRPYQLQGEHSKRLSSACTGCLYIWTLEQSHLQSTTTKKTWQNNTYSLFRNDKEQLPWQFFFVILESTLYLLDNFVLNHISEMKSTGDRRWRIKSTPTPASIREYVFKTQLNVLL